MRSFIMLALASSAVSAQSVADRVASTRNGAVSFYYSARAGVCGDGQNFVRIGRSYMGSISYASTNRECDMGPVQVRLTIDNGRIDRVETWVGRLRPRDARDLGQVPARDAAQYLLDIAARADGKPSAKAILGAALADSAIVWPALLRIAQDAGTRSHATRQDAMFWLSRFAASALSGKPNVLLDDSADDAEDIKGHAVFVMSQLPAREGIPMLLDVARTNKDLHVRSKALFWLGQSGDPRAIQLFASLLKSE